MSRLSLQELAAEAAKMPAEGVRTSRLSIKNSLSLQELAAEAAKMPAEGVRFILFNRSLDGLLPLKALPRPLLLSSLELSDTQSL